MTYISNKDFGLEASLNKVQKYSTVNKFGTALKCDSGVPTDIYDGASAALTTPIWVPPKAARIHTLVSTSLSDSDSGGVNPQSTGLRTVRVSYLPDWDTKETTEDVILDGTTGVVMTNEAAMINRIEPLTWGSGGLNVGVITATAAVDGSVTAAILVGNNQTQMCIFGVPSIQKLRVKKIFGEIIKGTGTTQRADMVFFKMIDPATNVAFNTAWINKENFSATESGGNVEHNYNGIPKKFNGPCIVKIQTISNAADVKTIGGFDAYLVDTN